MPLNLAAAGRAGGPAADEGACPTSEEARA